VPFDFLKRKKGPPAGATPGDAPISGSIPFEGLTEDWRLVGQMVIEGRLSDALNKREPITMSEVSWAPIDGSEALVPAPGLKSIDPYDLVIVLAGSGSLPEMSEAARIAHKVHKVSYEVALEAPPYRVVGTVHLYPGSEPESLLNRSTEMFVPVVGATATMGGDPIGPPGLDAILVNRAYLRGVTQVDARTGEPHDTLPGAPLGGVNWTDRSR
jgi:hypothetical protein